MKKVLTFGTFDIFHPGHEFYLKEAKKHGDILNVVVARDETVKKVKDHLPLNNEQKRLETIQKLPYVDKAVLGHRLDKCKIVEELNPDIICFGYDQSSFTEKIQENLKNRNLNPEIIRIKSFKPETFKSSILKESL